MSVLCLAACGISNYPEYVRQLLTVAIVNLPQRRVERVQERQRPVKKKKSRDAATSNYVVNLLAPRGRCDSASIGHDGDIMTVCDSGQTRTRTSENKGPRFRLLMHGIRLIQKSYLR